MKKKIKKAEMKAKEENEKEDKARKLNCTVEVKITVKINQK